MRHAQVIFCVDNPYYTIVQLIQDLCLLYFHKLMDTKILTENEQKKLMQMVNNHTNNKYNDDWKLLFRGTRDGIKRDDFYSKCNQITNIICIIQTPQNNVIGGFTTLTMDINKKEHVSDPDAFVYSIRSNIGKEAQLFPIKDNGKRAIHFNYNRYLAFGFYGSAFYMFLDGANEWILYVDSDATEYGLEPAEFHLNGNSDDYRMIPKEIEVFQLEKL